MRTVAEHLETTVTVTVTGTKAEGYKSYNCHHIEKAISSARSAQQEAHAEVVKATAKKDKLKEDFDKLQNRVNSIKRLKTQSDKGMKELKLLEAELSTAEQKLQDAVTQDEDTTEMDELKETANKLQNHINSILRLKTQSDKDAKELESLEAELSTAEQKLQEAVAQVESSETVYSAAQKGYADAHNELQTVLLHQEKENVLHNHGVKKVAKSSVLKIWEESKGRTAEEQAQLDKAEAEAKAKAEAEAKAKAEAKATKEKEVEQINNKIEEDSIMGEYGSEAMKAVIARIKMLAEEETEGCEVEQCEFEDLVHGLICKAVANSIGSYFQTGRYECHGKYFSANFDAENITAEIYYSVRNRQFFKEDGMDAQIVAQNMDRVAEWVEDCWDNDAKAEWLVKGDYSLVDVVFGIVEAQVESYEIGLSEYDSFHNNHCLSVGGACEILDGLGFSKEDYEEYGITWRDYEGYDEEGRDEDGRDYEGFDEEGFDKEGFNSEGYTKEDYDEDGELRIEDEEEEDEDDFQR